MGFWRNLGRGERVERELDEELRSTVELLAAEKARAGLSPPDARRAALVELGALESIKDAVRDVRRGAWVERTWRDLRYAARLLRRNPLFAATAALSIAIGIGSVTAIFTVANGLLLRPAVGVAEPDTVVDIVRREVDDDPGITPISYPDYLDLRDRARSFDHVYAYRIQPDSISFGVDDEVEAIFATVVSRNYFQALGVDAAIGRTLGSVDDERANGSPVVVLSHAFWQRRFGGDRSMVGKAVRVNGQPFTLSASRVTDSVVPSVVAPDVWIPVAMMGVVQPDGGSRGLTERNVPWLMVGARLARGVSRDQASAEVAVIGAALDRRVPESRDWPPGTSLAPGRSWIWSAETASPIPFGLRLIVSGFLAFLMAAVTVVLIIACTNVAGVLLARATVRRREIAVRAALGAARARIVWQLLTETVLLFVLAGVTGLVLARLATSMLVALLPRFQVPVAVSLPLDGRVVAFSLGTALITAIVFGLAPALHAARADVVDALKDDAQGPSDRLRLRQAFVIAQVALSTLLVVVALLLARTIGGVRSVASEFNPQGVDIASIDLAASGYSPESGRQLVREVLERVRALPGVVAATIADRVPDPGTMSFGIVTVPGVEPPQGQGSWMMNWNVVEPGYFETLQIPLVAGRDFTDSDRQTAIIGEAAAASIWQGQDPLGQSLFIAVDSRTPPVPFAVIGVARDLSPGPEPRERLALYVPFQQRYASRATIFTRTTREESMAAELRNVIRSIDADLLVTRAERMSLERAGPGEVQLRVAATVATSVGIIGLLLAGMGVYGVTAYAVARRTREIAIRLTLGAARGDVVRLVMRQGMGLVGIGSMIGLLLGLGMSRALSASPLRALPAEPSTFVLVGALLGFVGLLACYAPVRRAVRTTAMDALRHE